MKIIYFILIVFVVACNTKPLENNTNQIPLEGTWKLLSGTLIEKGDTVVTDYTKSVSFIKIINKTHFSFLKHDLNKGKDSTAAFDAGGGTYILVDSTYTENLDFCNARDWEGNAFKFTVSIHNDTLIQKGIEKIEKSGIDRLNIEKYLRVK
ncbi:MAG: hypothetical protein WCJ80_06175 [Bacteroidota bacterium]